VLTNARDIKSLSHWKKWPRVLHIFEETSDYFAGLSRDNRPTEHIDFLVHCGTSELMIAANFVQTAIIPLLVRARNEPGRTM
jgi:hypothetical protein